MSDSKIEYYELESRHFNFFKHFSTRILEMKTKSNYGAQVASKWNEIVAKYLRNETYPVVHPKGQETFSMYAEFPSGVFEYALDIDGATSFIKERSIVPEIFAPTKIIDSVDEGNINKDTRSIKTNHKNPVMVLSSQYLTDGKLYCINGNHRILEAYKNNEERIEVYVFKELDFVSFFYDVLSQAMYFLEIDYNNVIKNERNHLKEEHTSFAFKFR